jgi:hypothetical protein
MPNSDKRDRIRRAIEEHQAASNRQLARDLGVSDKTVAAVRAEVRKAAEAAEAPHELVREQSGRLVALVDLIVDRPAPPGITAAVTEVPVAAGFEIPPELAHLPRRPAA